MNHCHYQHLKTPFQRRHVDSMPDFLSKDHYTVQTQFIHLTKTTSISKLYTQNIYNQFCKTHTHLQLYTNVSSAFIHLIHIIFDYSLQRTVTYTRALNPAHGPSELFPVLQYEYNDKDLHPCHHCTAHNDMRLPPVSVIVSLHWYFLCRINNTRHLYDMDLLAVDKRQATTWNHYQPTALQWSFMKVATMVTSSFCWKRQRQVDLLLWWGMNGSNEGEERNYNTTNTNSI